MSSQIFKRLNLRGFQIGKQIRFFLLSDAPHHLSADDFGLLRCKSRFPADGFEGMNNKAKLTMRKSYGFRTFRVLELALYHSLGKLPEPELTHEFF